MSGSATNVVTGWVMLPIPKLAGGSPNGVPSAVKSLVTLCPSVNVAEGKITVTLKSKLLPTLRLNGPDQTKAGATVPIHPGSQSAAGEEP